MSDIDVAELLRFHRFLLGETDVRLELFGAAIAQAVRPGDIVLDLGTGTGILACLACRAGARRVYAVEPTPAIDLARLVARANAVDDRIVFIDAAFCDARLPERVDVIVADVFGICGLTRDGLRAMLDARQRALSPHGAMIPASIDVMVAPVELPALYDRDVEFWRRPSHGIDLSPIRQLAVNNRYPVRVERAALLANGVNLAHVDLTRVEADGVEGTIDVAVQRRGIVSGLCCWFVATLVGDITVANEPGRSTTNYAQAFLPIERAIAVDEGDRIRARVRRSRDVDFRWQVAILRRGATDPAVEFDQSTFCGIPMSLALLRDGEAGDTLALSPRGAAERFVLESIVDGRSIGTIERLVRERYPAVVTSDEDAARFVDDIVGRST
jgi:protein arginine N-methyltransferase 1